MIDRYSIRHQEQSAATDADQAEKLARTAGSSTIDAAIRDDQIAEALEDDTFEPELVGLDDTNPGRERWHRQDLGVEAGVTALQEEILRRKKYLGGAYPFELEGNLLTYTGEDSGFYSYCLGITQAPNITTGDLVQLPRTFERVVAIVVKLYMGIHTSSFHSGAPRDPERELGTWAAAMAQLAQDTGEWWWGPEEGLPEEPTVGGDGGVDFVVWKHAPDARPGHLFVVGQCACGNDWSNKLNDLDLPGLGAWFKPISFIPPIKAFATPFALSDGNFQMAHKRAGWVLDRIRLVSMADKVKHEAEYTAWSTVLSDMTSLSLGEAA